ncbi:MAG: peptide deformylase [Thermoproteota archaeon]|jgi:peptide deformylase
MDFEGNAINNYALSDDTLQIVNYPNPVLKKTATHVKDFNDELKDLAIKMIHTMYAAPGIGLAAPQVGKSLRLFVLDVNFSKETYTSADGEEKKRLINMKPMVFVNPEIIEKDGSIVFQEGCLSLPGIFEDVNRFESITAKFQDLTGKSYEVEMSKLFSICFQHELDHLNGVVFIDHLSRLKKSFIQKKILKKNK